MFNLGKKKKKTTGKVDEHYWEFAVDRRRFRSRCRASPARQDSKATKMKKEALHSEKSEFQGKLRRIFFPDEYKEPQKKEYEPKDYIYIQMKLNIEKISPEFLKELEEYRLSGISIRKCNEEDL